MDLTISFSVTKIDGREFNVLSVQNRTLKSYAMSSMLSDIGENMVKVRTGLIIDLKKVRIIDSLNFGSLANIVTKAKESGTTVKLKVSPSLLTLLQQLSFDKVVEVIQ